MSMDQIDKERLDILAGARGSRNGASAAVRRSDLVAIPRLKTMTAAKVSAAPTAAEYNALLADVQALYDALVQIASKVKP